MAKTQVYGVRLRPHTIEALRKRAALERRSMAEQAGLILDAALGIPPETALEPPGPAPVPWRKVLRMQPRRSSRSKASPG